MLASCDARPSDRIWSAHGDFQYHSLHSPELQAIGDSVACVAEPMGSGVAAGVGGGDRCYAWSRDVSVLRHSTTAPSCLAYWRSDPLLVGDLALTDDRGLERHIEFWGPWDWSARADGVGIASVARVAATISISISIAYSMAFPHTNVSSERASACDAMDHSPTHRPTDRSPCVPRT